MSEISKMWDLLKKSGAGTMQFKLFKKNGDKKPYRLIVFAEGVDEVADIMKFLDKRGGPDITPDDLKEALSDWSGDDDSK